jgi:WXG100 family type VII secretion target
MADMISMSLSTVSSKIGECTTLIEDIQGALNSLDGKIMSLQDPSGGNWQGDAATKFMEVYEGMQTKIKTEFPQLLRDLNENLEKNRANIEAADQAGTGK